MNWTSGNYCPSWNKGKMGSSPLHVKNVHFIWLQKKEIWKAPLFITEHTEQHKVAAGLGLGMHKYITSLRKYKCSHLATCRHVTLRCQTPNLSHTLRAELYQVTSCINLYKQLRDSQVTKHCGFLEKKPQTPSLRIQLMLEVRVMVHPTCAWSTEVLLASRGLLSPVWEWA